MHRKSNVALRRSIASVCAVTAACCAAPLSAQQASSSDGVLQEITVTASRTEELASRVPVSIAAYTQEMLDGQGVRSASDLMQLTPGIDFSSGGFGFTSSISIRGIASSVGSATTGIYIDETPVQTRTLLFSASNVYPAIFDLERVEVLRGPQGTLFGAASEGGTVRFITPQPSLKEYSGYTRAELGSTAGSGDPSYEAGFAFGGPLIEDRLAFRASAYHRHDGGYIDRIRFVDAATRDEDSNWLDTTAGRFALTWAPLDNLTITPSIMVQDSHNENDSVVWSNTSDIEARRYVSGNDQNSTTDEKFTLPALTMRWDLPSMSLFSNTSYFDKDSHTLFDYTLFDISYFVPGGDPTALFAIPEFYSNSPQWNEQQTFTQEMRLQSSDPDARLTWVVGAFYSRAKQRALEHVNAPYFGEYFGGVPLEVIFGAPAINGETVYIDEFRALDEEQALFGSVTFAITSKLKATAGVRVSRTSFEFTEAKDGPAAGGASTSAGKQEESPVNPKVALSYQMNDDNLFYLSAARGYRVGGANAPIPTYDACVQALSTLGMTEAPLEYDSDSTWSYEVGSKNRLAGGRLQIDASVYYIEWKDIISAIPGLPGCPFSFTSNLGSAESKGFDLQVQWQALNALMLGASVGYNSAEYLETVLPTGATQPLVTQGHTLGAVPWTLVGTAEYHFAAPWGADGYARAIQVYRSKDNNRRPVNDPNDDAYDPAIPDPGSTNNLELRIGATFDEGWDVSAFVDNALNRRNVQQYSRDAVGAMVFTFVPARPRTYGLTLSRTF